MSGTKNDVLVGKNADFSQVDAPNAATRESNGLFTNGQLWIGTTSVNAGGTHINVGTLTSSDNSVTVGYNSPNINLTVTAGNQVLKTLSDDSNVQVQPALGNIQLVGHVFQGDGTTKIPTSVAGTNLLNLNPMSASRWIVDSKGFNGTHTTIASALTSASSGDTIMIVDGTYTENLTLKAGVNISSYIGDGYTGNVTIVGNCTASFAGTCTLSGIRLQTNSANCLTVSGSSATVVNLVDCYINASNNTAISFSAASTSARINMYQVTGDLGTTGIAYFANSSTGIMFLFNCTLFNNGNSSTANTISAGNVTFFHTIFSNPTTSSGTGSIGIFYSNCDTSTSNSTSFTVGGSGAHNFYDSAIFSGTASCATISQTLNCHNCVLSSSNTNVITGAGTLNYSALSFSGSSSTMNTTTQNGGTLIGGKFQAPSAGFLGEQIRSAVASASAVTLSDNTAANVTSISLTAGVWDVTGSVVYQAGAITGTDFYASIGTTSATLGTGGDNAFDTPTAPTAGANSSVFVPAFRITLTSTTTVYLVAFARFTVGTLKAFGRISATRVG